MNRAATVADIKRYFKQFKTVKEVYVSNKAPGDVEVLVVSKFPLRRKQVLGLVPMLPAACKLRVFNNNPFWCREFKPEKLVTVTVRKWGK